MSVPQISVFLESRPGHLHRILDAFVKADINVRGFSASDTGDYGVVRFIVDDAERASEVLKAMGCATAVSEVLCLRLPDRPGELARVMGIIAERELNVLYTYSLISTYIAVCVKDIAHAEEILRDEPVELADSKDIAARLDGIA